MFPPIYTNAMSLTPFRDCRALSMACCLTSNGEIIKDSVEVNPSWIRVDYKLTYEDVDDMIDDGVAFSEEWQIGGMLKIAKLRRKLRMEKGERRAKRATLWLRGC